VLFIQLYASPDVKGWTMAGAFGPAGATGGQWECPDLFPLAVEGGGTKWVLIVNINPGGVAGGSGTQYFVGDFDGSRFVADSGATGTHWADYGSDFYAAVSWNGVPRSDGRRVWIGWMSNWKYAQDVPTSPWRSAMTVPRTLTLRRTPAGLVLVQTPVRELDALRTSAARRFDGGTLAAANAWLAALGDLPSLLDVELAFDGVLDATPFDIQLGSGADERTVVHVDPAARQLVLDRSRAGRTTFHRDFTLRHPAPLRIGGGEVLVRLLLDASSLEVFAQRGETVLTDLVFLSPGPRRLSLAADGKSPRVRSIGVNPLAVVR
jgi:fructan beta-fructosidase